MNFKLKRILFRLGLGLLIYLAISFSPARSAPLEYSHPSGSQPPRSSPPIAGPQARALSAQHYHRGSQRFDWSLCEPL